MTPVMWTRIALNVVEGIQHIREAEKTRALPLDDPGFAEAYRAFQDLEKQKGDRRDQEIAEEQARRVRDNRGKDLDAE